MKSLRVIAFALAVTALVAPAQAADRFVTVTGEASVNAAPDLAVIRVGVASNAKTAREASDANARQMTDVIAAIKAAGIADRDIQTSRLALQAQYDSSKPGLSKLVGFQLSNQITMQIRDIGNLPALLDRVIAAGANEMSGMEFVVSEQSKLLDKARTEAIADARRKAELYAQAAGARLGAVASISEEGAAPPAYPMQAMRVAGVPIAPGEKTLRVTVSVSYELTH